MNKASCKVLCDRVWEDDSMVNIISLLNAFSHKEIASTDGELYVYVIALIEDCGEGTVLNNPETVKVLLSHVDKLIAASTSNGIRHTHNRRRFIHLLTVLLKTLLVHYKNVYVAELVVAIFKIDRYLLTNILDDVCMYNFNGVMSVMNSIRVYYEYMDRSQFGYDVNTNPINDPVFNSMIEYVNPMYDLDPTAFSQVTWSLIENVSHFENDDEVSEFISSLDERAFVEFNTDDVAEYLLERVRPVLIMTALTGRTNSTRSDRLLDLKKIIMSNVSAEIGMIKTSLESKGAVNNIKVITDSVMTVLSHVTDQNTELMFPMLSRANLELLVKNTVKKTYNYHFIPQEVLKEVMTYSNYTIIMQRKPDGKEYLFNTFLKKAVEYSIDMPVISEKLILEKYDELSDGSPLEEMLACYVLWFGSVNTLYSPGGAAYDEDKIREFEQFRMFFE